MLIVTHEMQFAEDVADRVIFMDHGRIVEEGPPQRLFRSPSHPRTRAFLRAVVDRRGLIRRRRHERRSVGTLRGAVPLPDRASLLGGAVITVDRHARSHSCWR